MPPELHEDFGEKIGGAKKDLWKDRGLSCRGKGTGDLSRRTRAILRSISAI